MDALIVTDIQNDFLPGGALAVPEGDRIIPVTNRLMPHFDLVVATQDWHPPDHGSFAATHGRKIGELIDLYGLPQILWPVHCVQETPGAAFAPGLDTRRVEGVFRKGVDRNIDSYSAIYDNGHRRSTGLAEFLKKRGVSDVYLVGLATDYCVKFTALDAIAEGFKVHVIEDACRGVNLKPDDVAAALEEMRGKGISITSSDTILSANQRRPASDRPPIVGGAESAGSSSSPRIQGTRR
jgi:nicotinamidase/pyrazinamidase